MAEERSSRLKKEGAVKTLDRQTSLEWDSFYEEPTYKPKMPVTHTPLKAPAESEAMYDWPIIINGEQTIVRVNHNQKQYLSLTTTTEEQRNEFLKRVWEAAEAAATITATEKPEDLPSPASSKGSTDTVAEIANRSKFIETSLRNNPDVKNLFEENNNECKNDEQLDEDGGKISCQDRHHIFEQRTKTHLAAPAKKFVRAVNALKYQLNRANFADEISQQFGDDLLQDVKQKFGKVEEAREYCLEVLEEQERLQYDYYLQNKFEDVCECERIHRNYFEKMVEDKVARNQQQMSQPPTSQVQPPHLGSFLAQPPPGAHIAPNIITTTAANILPNMMTSTPFHQNAIPLLGPIFDPMFGQNQQHQDHAHGQNYNQYQQSPPPGAHSNPTFGQHQGQNYGQSGPQQNYGQSGPQQNYGQSGPQQNVPPGFNNVNPPPGFETNAPPGFNIYEDQGQGESRIPTPSAPSVMETRHHTRFKLQEELSLVEKWDASEPRKYMAFRAQWTNFYNKMKSEQRSNLDLYYALMKVLDGAARDFVYTKYPSDQSYAQAIAKLDEHFYNPTNLLRDMVQNLLKGQKMSDSYDSLLSGITKLNDAWHDLNQADLTKDQLKGLLFIAATEKNLSNESWRCWLEEQNNPKYQQNPMAAFEIATYLGAIKRAMLNAQKRKNIIGGPQDTNSENPPKAGRQGKRQSTLYGAYSNSVGNQKLGSNPPKAMTQQQAHGPNNTCVFCGEKNTHKYQLYCPKIRDLTPKNIYNIMQKTGIECQMCLGLGHRTKQCPPMLEGFLKPCSVKENNMECGRYHCRALHKRAAEESKESAPPKQE